MLWVGSAGAGSLELAGAAPVPSQRVMSQGEWARRLVRVLDLERALPPEPQPSDLAGLLCPDQAPNPIGASARGLSTSAGLSVAAQPRVPPRSELPVRFVLRVPLTALYEFTVEGVGLQRWVIDGHPVGHLDPSALGVAQAAALIPLRAGPHEITGYLARGAQAERVELAVHRALCIAPADGWHPSRALRYGTFARTLVRVFDLDRRLPELEDETIRIEAENFDSASGGGSSGPSEHGDRASGARRGLVDFASGGSWAEAVSSPAEFSWSLRLDEPRVVTLRAQTHGAADQIWSVDGRHRVTLKPDVFEGVFLWNHVLTLPLSAGRHVVRVRMAPGSGVDRFELVPRRSTDVDYARILMSLGFRGDAPVAPMTRARVRAAVAGASFGQLTLRFRRRLAGERQDPSLVLVDLEPVRPTSRAIAPMLPGEL